MSQSLLQYAFHLLLATAASFGPATDAARLMAQAAPTSASEPAVVAATTTASQRLRRTARVSLRDPYYSFSRGQRSGARS
ncbi:MAG: hypothetical protein IPG63_12640 [Xanthomonadales bacterium]|nr:hypothetical protein [Xanthomonadales bacterium]MBK7145246.1 hypothetical protein [Xanthomonadales bacterium]MCC6562144.1 hypothetical protein [Xanthomonadales bacterium]